MTPHSHGEAGGDMTTSLPPADSWAFYTPTVPAPSPPLQGAAFQCPVHGGHQTHQPSGSQSLPPTAHHSALPGHPSLTKAT